MYQSSIDAEQGKVTVSGLMDPATVIKKLNKVGKLAQLWGAKPGVVSQLQKLQLGGDGGGGKDKQPKGGDGGAKGQQTKGGGGEGGGGKGGKDANMVLPQPTPQQMQQVMQMKGMKLSHVLGWARVGGEVSRWRGFRCSVGRRWVYGRRRGFAAAASVRLRRFSRGLGVR